MALRSHSYQKVSLIDDFNPEWEDLAYSIGLDEEYMQSIKDAYDQGLYDEKTP